MSKIWTTFKHFLSGEPQKLKTWNYFSSIHLGNLKTCQTTWDQKFSNATCDHTCRNIHKIQICKHGMPFGRGTSGTPSKEFELGGPIADFRYFWGKVEPIRLSDKVFRTAWIIRGQKSQWLILRLISSMLTVRVHLPICVKYLWEWLDGEIGDLGSLGSFGR